MDLDINKLKAEKIIFQKNLAKEREEKQKLSERVEELESLCKRKTEEIDALQLCNHQLIHKCESLQQKLNQKQNSWSWWSGKDKKAIEVISVLEEDLQNKISENEQVHIRIFEQRQKYKNKISELKQKLRESDEYVRNSAEKIESMAIEITQYQSSMQSLFKENKEYSSLLDYKNKETQDSHNFFIKTTNELKQKILYFQNKLKTVVSLDMDNFENFSVYNAPRFNKTFQNKQAEWLGKICFSLENSLPVFQSLLKKFPIRLSFLYFNADKKSKRIIKEIEDYSEKIFGTFSSLVKAFAEKNFFNHKSVELLQKTGTQASFFIRLLSLELVIEENIRKDYEKTLKINKDLSSNLSKVSILINRAISLLLCSATSIESLWSKIQEIIKQLISTIIETLRIFIEKLALDKSSKYKIQVKDTSNINSEILADIQNLIHFLNQICSEIMQLRPNFYYSLNPLYSFTSNYLSDLRKTSYLPGINYSQSLENVKTLSEFETKIKDLTQTMNSLEKQNFFLLKEIETYKAEVIKIENELAAVEQNLERKAIESGNNILHEPESISEDVKSGAQRFALRLTDSKGEPIPISTLTVDNDIYLKIQEIAIYKINELAEQFKLNDQNLEF